MKEKSPETRKQAAYVLPNSLIRDIKHEAADQGVRPNRIVELACEEYLTRRRSRARHAEPASAR